MKHIAKVPDPLQIEDTLGWSLANLDRLAIGALIAISIVAVMLAMRWVGHRLLAESPTCGAGAASSAASCRRLA
jgi:hypothetical protein